MTYCTFIITIIIIIWHCGPFSLTLACLVILAHCFLSWALCNRLLIPVMFLYQFGRRRTILQILTFIHLGFIIFLGNLKSSILTTCPTHSIPLVLISDVILGTLYTYILEFHIGVIFETPCSHVGPWIFLSGFLSQATRIEAVLPVIVLTSLSYVTACLVMVLCT